MKWNMVIDDTLYKYSVTWFSTDDSVAKVDNTGLITGVSPGKADIYVYLKFKGAGVLNGKIGHRYRTVIVGGDVPKTMTKASSKAVKAVKDALFAHVEGFKAKLDKGLTSDRLYYMTKNLNEKYYVVNVYDTWATNSFFETGKLGKPQFTLNVSKSDYSVSLVYDDKHKFNLTHN